MPQGRACTLLQVDEMGSPQIIRAKVKARSMPKQNNCFYILFLKRYLDRLGNHIQIGLADERNVRAREYNELHEQPQSNGLMAIPDRILWG